MFRIVSFGVVIRWLSWLKAAKYSTSQAKWPDVAYSLQILHQALAHSHLNSKEESTEVLPDVHVNFEVACFGGVEAIWQEVHKLCPSPTKENTARFWHAYLCSHQCYLQVCPGSFKFSHASVDWFMPIYTIKIQITALDEITSTMHPWQLAQ